MVCFWCLLCRFILMNGFVGMRIIVESKYRRFCCILFSYCWSENIWWFVFGIYVIPALRSGGLEMSRILVYEYVCWKLLYLFCGFVGMRFCGCFNVDKGKIVNVGGGLSNLFRYNRINLTLPIQYNYSPILLLRF